MIYLSRPDLDDQESKAINEVLQTGMLVQGKHVAEFEAEMLEWLTPSHHSVAVSNGTAALHLALLALDIKVGDAVIVPTYSWPATANVVELCGATPIFVDIEPETWGMDPKNLAQVLDVAKKKYKERLKAVIVVHAFGCPAKMDELLKLCAEANIPLVEDAACAIGSTWGNQYVGSLGELGCFSFHPRKVVTTGEGGLISCKNKEYSRVLRALRNHGLDPEASSPDFIRPGFNYRMTDFQASMGKVQLAKLPEMLKKRQGIAQGYLELLGSSPLGFQKPFQSSTTNWQSFVVTLPKSIERQLLINYLAENSIASTIGTWHIPMTRYYREKYGFRPGDFPVTDIVFSQSVSLPLHQNMMSSDIDKVASCVKDFFKNKNGL